MIKSISCRRVLNSHVVYTNEFIVELAEGAVGQAASSQGETISIYEDRKVSFDPRTILRTIKTDGLLGREIEQEEWDHYLQGHIPFFGRNNGFALSEAFFVASRNQGLAEGSFGGPQPKMKRPLLALNILNGGWHAYTNPVLSDFSEFLLVAQSRDYDEVVGEHNEIQRAVRERQLGQSKTVVSGHPVNSFPTRDNREVLDFLLDVVAKLGLSPKYDLMIDASAGDLWKDDAYHFGITDGRTHRREEFVQYWMEMIRQYHLRFLEDPFQERDFGKWHDLTTAQDVCRIIGDNLYSSDEGRIREGADKQYAHGAVVKPNQAGTVTAVRRSLAAALQTGQIAMTSHRSISTESTFLSLLSCAMGAQYIKIGPLFTDYSSVVRLNEILRLTEDVHADAD